MQCYGAREVSSVWFPEAQAITLLCSPHAHVSQYFVRRDFAAALVIVLSVVAYYIVLTSSQHQAIMNQLGIICNFFTICFFASPLSTMVSVSW